MHFQNSYQKDERDEEEEVKEQSEVNYYSIIYDSDILIFRSNYESVCLYVSDKRRKFETINPSIQRRWK
jgi:hypothetical protein